MPKPYLSPRNGLVFKRLFGNARDTSILTHFLQSALNLPAEDYQEVSIIDPHLGGDQPDDKEGILDVKVKTPSGKIIDIEIQRADLPQMRERIVFYLSRMVTEQISKGEDYREIKRSICILITDYVQIPENQRYHNRYRLHDAETGSEFSDLLEINTLELPKLPQDDGTELWDWLKFLNATTEEEFTMLAEKNSQVGEAVFRLLELSQDERTRLLAESQEKLRRNMAARMYGAEERWREEGREKGRKEAQLAIAKNALQKNLSLEDIAERTGLTPEEIRPRH
jgi:predicted transposase/invertase (TIGR01784 family)